jgi:hypothetical protein
MITTRKLALPLLGLFICSALAGVAWAGDDTARFAGQWKAAIPYQGGTVKIVSVHDAKGFKNYMILPQSAAPAGDGTFSAADGNWTSSSPPPNNSGTYQFVDNNSVLCKNALGQPLLWQRDDAPLPPVLAPPPGPAMPIAGAMSLPAGTNLAQVKVSEAIDLCRKMATAWHADAFLISAYVFRPSSDGTVNLQAMPQAFTISFYSPSAASHLSIVSTPNVGTFAANPFARPPTVIVRAIPPGTVDLTQAISNERLFGFTGNAGSAQMFFAQENGKPLRLVWSLDVGEPYPRIVSAATGALLSPFQVYDDKVAAYNKLAAETAAAVAAMRSHNRHRGQAYAGEWAGGGLHFWSGESHGSESGTNGESGTSNEQDTWDNDVAAQNAWEAGDTDAEANFDAGTPTEVDVATYGGGSGD